MLEEDLWMQLPDDQEAATLNADIPSVDGLHRVCLMEAHRKRISRRSIIKSNAHTWFKGRGA